MTLDEQVIQYNALISAIKEGSLHSKPSPETIMMISDLKDELREMIEGRNVCLKGLNNKLTHMHDLLFGDDERDGILSEINNRLAKQNGSVADLQRWKWALGGGIAVLTTLFVPIVLKILI